MAGYLPAGCAQDALDRYDDHEPELADDLVIAECGHIEHLAAIESTGGHEICGACFDSIKRALSEGRPDLVAGIERRFTGNVPSPSEDAFGDVEEVA